MIPETPSFIPRPSATVTVDPVGARDSVPREHLIKILIDLNATEERFADRSRVTAVARRAFTGFVPPDGAIDHRQCRDVSASTRGKAGAVTTVVVAVEGSAVWPTRPEDERMSALRESLVADGYRVALRERRECVERGCSVDALVEWRRPDDVPPRWFSARHCGNHDFRTCPGCKTVYRLTCQNEAGQAPALHCEVCQHVLVEWGSSKVWVAERV